MKRDVISFSAALIAALLTLPIVARADSKPDFDDDAKPILKVQPHLIQQVESLYDVKDSGEAKYPGDDDHRAMPPYIFSARPRGSSGPFFLRLLIQPGPPGRILRVVDMRKVHLGERGAPSAPSVASQSRTAPQPSSQPSAPASQPSAPQVSAPAQQPSEPTADTPSGPLMDSGDQGSSSPAPSSNQPGLAPPPDPAPAN